MGLFDFLFGDPPKQEVTTQPPLKGPLYDWAESFGWQILPFLTGSRYPTFPGKVDPGLTPSINNVMQMMQGNAIGGAPQIMGTAQGLLGEFMNPASGGLNDPGEWLNRFKNEYSSTVNNPGSMMSPSMFQNPQIPSFFDMGMPPQGPRSQFGNPWSSFDNARGQIGGGYGGGAMTGGNMMPPWMGQMPLSPGRMYPNVGMPGGGFGRGYGAPPPGMPPVNVQGGPEPGSGGGGQLQRLLEALMALNKNKLPPGADLGSNSKDVIGPPKKGGAGTGGGAGNPKHKGGSGGSKGTAKKKLTYEEWLAKRGPRKSGGWKAFEKWAHSQGHTNLTSKSKEELDRLKSQWHSS